MTPSPSPTPPIAIDLRQAVCALAEALGLVGIDERQHGERVAFMAVQCARSLGWDAPRQSELFHAGLLHDCGVSSSRVHTHLVTELDWAGAETHCIVGERLLAGFAPLAHLAPLIRRHHSHWDALLRHGVDPELALQANLIYLTDRVDALLAQRHMAGDPMPFAAVRDTVARLSGEYFAPALADAFLTASDNEAFWLTLEPLNLVAFVRDMAAQGGEVITRFDDLRRLACIFAQIVDAKSRFTFEHSQGVAALAVHLGRLAGLAPGRIALVEVAALLHDLGKLGVPDEVLEKPGRLTAEETAVMHRHSFDTFRILRGIGGLEEVALWAGSHHETLLGDGYPFHRHDDALPSEARVIMVADIFQALAQDRPYRASLPPERIMAILGEMAEVGRIDRDLVALAGRDPATCWRVATQPVSLTEGPPQARDQRSL